MKSKIDIDHGSGASPLLGGADAAQYHVEDCRLQRGDTRKPKFCEWLRGVWASERSPIRDGMYIRTVRRNGRANPGTFYELTDGSGNFWMINAKYTIFLPPNVKDDLAGANQPSQSTNNADAGSSPSTCWAAKIPPDTTTKETGGKNERSSSP
jgi:hypothetical protein